MSHRRVDVDSLALDEDDDFDAQTPVTAAVDAAELSAAATARAKDVATLLSKSDISGALTRALDGAPYGTGDGIVGAKDVCTKAVVDILNAAKSTEVPNLVADLSQAQLALLLRYVYRAMATPQAYQNTALLMWHEKITDVTGTGGIVRVLSDPRAL